MMGRTVTFHTRRTHDILMLTVIILLSAHAAACVPSSGLDDPITLRVFSASSLTDVLLEAADQFESERRHVNIEPHFAGSSRLRAQLEEGARADIFIPADPSHLSVIVHLLVESSYTEIAYNEMVVAISNSEHAPQTSDELIAPGVRIVIALPNVPAGRYARLLISGLGQREDFPEGYAERVLDNVVSEETNVRAVLAKVVLGEADAGFVYRTDVRETGLRWLGIPAQEPGDIIYAGAVLKDSPNVSLAQEFLGFLSSERGRGIVSSHGFLEPLVVSSDAPVPTLDARVPTA